MYIQIIVKEFINRYYLDYVTFEITKEGLKAKYNDPDNYE